MRSEMRTCEVLLRAMAKRRIRVSDREEEELYRKFTRKETHNMLAPHRREVRGAGLSAQLHLAVHAVELGLLCCFDGAAVHAVELGRLRFDGATPRGKSATRQAQPQPGPPHRQPRCQRKPLQKSYTSGSRCKKTIKKRMRRKE
jgi:hypothetical protein